MAFAARHICRAQPEGPAEPDTTRHPVLARGQAQVGEIASWERRNIARAEVVAEVAQALAAARPDLLDPERLARDIDGEEARAAQKEDVLEARFRGITCFPCLGLRRPVAEPRWLIGWRAWGAFLAALRDFAPDLAPERRAVDAAAYRRYWGGATTREIKMALARDPAGPDPATGAGRPSHRRPLGRSAPVTAPAQRRASMAAPSTPAMARPNSTA